MDARIDSGGDTEKHADTDELFTLRGGALELKQTTATRSEEPR